MFIRGILFIAICLASTAIGVAANNADDAEPVLRLRFQDPLPVSDINVKLRPRFDDRVTVRSEPVPMPRIEVADAGSVGKFAYVSTPHPNVVIALGAAQDFSESGRQIDRAVADMGRGSLFTQRDDSAPFVGIGYRTGSVKKGWSFDGTIGAGLVNQAQDSRISNMYYAADQNGYEAEARANLRLRYSF